MDQDTIKQVCVLAFTSVILYFSGIHLMTIGNLKNLSDGLVVIAFFLAFFPFLGNFATLSIKCFKRVLSLKIF